MQRTALAVVLAVIVGALLVSAHPDAASRPAPRKLTIATAPVPVDPLAVALSYASQTEAVARYVAAVDLAKFLASIPPPPPIEPQQTPEPPEPTVTPSTSSWPHTDAWWHGVGTCEQGGLNDPYFGYFSFMDGSQGGQPWAEQVAAGNALLASVGAERESQGGPWADSCVDAGYAASPSG